LPHRSIGPVKTCRVYHSGRDRSTAQFSEGLRRKSVYLIITVKKCGYAIPNVVAVATVTGARFDGKGIGAYNVKLSSNCWDWIYRVKVAEGHVALGYAFCAVGGTANDAHCISTA
ncbi:MAG: hypothetical protein KAJ01_06055, partial [Candidatus Hydrogenedentes bacterium]|nr:hypothetical protein [Candidatus Hydrogenedentota bacterium]